MNCTVEYGASNRSVFGKKVCTCSRHFECELLGRSSRENRPSTTDHCSWTTFMYSAIWTTEIVHVRGRKVFCETVAKQRAAKIFPGAGKKHNGNEHTACKRNRLETRGKNRETRAQAIKKLFLEKEV